MTQKPGIYCIRFGLNERFYIGSTMDLGRRRSQHLHKLRKNIHENPKLQNYYNKYGKELFSFQILEIIDDSYETVRFKEQEYLNKYFAQEYIKSGFKDKRFDDLLLNVSPEVDLMRVHWTEDRKEAQRERNKNFVWTEEMRKKISNANKGRIISPEEKLAKTLGETYYWEAKCKEKNRECIYCKDNHVRTMGTRMNHTKNIRMRRFKCMTCGKGYSKPDDTGTSCSDT